MILPAGGRGGQISGFCRIGHSRRMKQGSLWEPRRKMSEKQRGGTLQRRRRFPVSICTPNGEMRHMYHLFAD